MRTQLQNDYDKDPEISSYPETLAEACNPTICWEGKKKSNNRHDRGRDKGSVNLYNNDRRRRGNSNRDRDNNKNNESNNDPSDRLCHREACYGGCRNLNYTGKTQKIETVGMPTMPTSTVVTMKTTIIIVQATTQSIVASMCHGHKNSVTVITTILISYNITVKEILRQC